MTSPIPTARLEEIVAAWDTPETVFISEKDILALVTELLAAREELARLKHDISRHIEIAATEATEAEALRAEIERLIKERDAAYRCLLPVSMAMAEAELTGQPFEDDQVVLHYSGCGASDQVTAGMVRAALRPISDGEAIDDLIANNGEGRSGSQKEDV